MPRSREFLRSLYGPHVLFSFAVGVVQGVLTDGFLHHPYDAHPIPSAFLRLVGSNSGFVVAATVLALAGSAAAVLAKRLTGNVLVSACAGALVALHPVGPPVLGETLAAGFGLLAAGIRVLPGPASEGMPLFGRREIVALILLVLGALSGPAVLAMPLVILLGDLAYAPAGPRAVLRRTGKLFLFQVAAVAPAAASSKHWVSRSLLLDDQRIAGVAWVIVALAALLILFRSRIRQTLVIAAAFAVAWMGALDVPRLVFTVERHADASILPLFGVALLISTILWRIAIALTTPRREPAPELPLPSVPAVRDLIRGMRAEAGAANQSRRVDPTTGIRSTVESAVAGAVAATLEQIRLTFRGPHVTEPPGTPEQVLWNRLLTTSSGGPLPSEKPEEAMVRWRAVASKHLEPRIKHKAGVICVGATPWPLVAALAEEHAAVTLVERTHRAAQLASADLGAARNVMVVRHDGKRLHPIGAGTADAVISLFEPTRDLPAEILALLREARRVLRPGGVAGIGFADLALPASQEALARGTPTEIFVNREVLETLAKMAGFGRCEVAASVLPTVSIAWLLVEPAKGPAS